jgi:hypothetical protein
MKAKFIKTAERIILLLILLLAGNNIIHASDKDSTILKSPVNPGSPSVTINRKPVDINVRSFEELEQYIEGGGEFNVNNNRPGYSNEEIDAFNNTADTTLQHLRSWASHTIEETEATNNLVDYLSPSDINRLPVGFKKKIGNNTYLTIAVSSAIFKPDYAELTVFARIKLPNGQTIFFGIQQLKLSYNGGIIGDAKLVLLGDVAIPINNGNARIILRGSFSLATGTSNGPPLTFVSIDCKGFKKLGLEAYVEFPRSLMQPVTPSGYADTTGSVRASFSLQVSDWNDILTGVSFQTPFQIKGLSGFVFTLSDAYIDLSDFQNHASIVFPAGYQEKYLDRNAPNTWRGVYVKQISIKIPKSFKDKTNPNNRVGFGVEDLVIDNNGITGIFYAENILPVTKGNAGGWKFSLDSIRIALEANRLIRAGFGGKIGLPIANPKDEDSLNKRKFLEYSAVINFNGGYVCRVTTKDTLDFDIWRAKTILLPNSYVQLTGNKDSLSAEAMLNGKMGIESHTMNANDSSSTSSNALAKLQGIEFRSLHLTTYAPYLTAEYLGYSGEIRFGNFPLSIENIALQRLSSNNNNEVAISFGIKINLGDSAEFSGKSRLKVIGALQTESGTHRWKFARLEIESLEIHANIKDAFTLDGFVNFFNNPSTDASRPGRGFEGALKVKFKGLRKDNSSNSIEISASAVFGKASTYRYWYVDGSVDFGTGIGAAPFRLRGFGGGAYYRMSKNNTAGGLTFGSQTGVPYKADSTAGLGVKAMILFDGGTKVLNGSAAFEINFYRGGGIRYIGIFGYLKLSEDILPIGTNKTTWLNGKFDSLTKFANSLTPAQEIDLIEELKNNPSKGAKTQTEGANPNDEKPGESGISAYAGIQYDFTTKVFHANFDMYIIAAGGTLKGVGPGNRAGWVVFHIEPSKWYLRIGTPTDPVGVKIGIGPLNISTSAYFMLGSEMPPFPPPPQQVINILAQSGLAYSSNMNSGDLAGGRGIAFGASLNASTGDIKFLFFYANFAAGIGFDVMIKDYGDAHCAGNPDRIGINGWYAKGRAYAYLQGVLGIKIKIFGLRKNIPIITAGAAALLEAKLPNPTWVGGSLGFYVNVLGGLIKGHFNFKFSFGNDCVITNEDPGSEASINVIESITPDHNATDVDRFVNPQLKLRLKLSDVLDVPREDGSGTDYYRAKVQSFKLYKASDNSEVSAVTQVNEAQDVLTLIPSVVLNATTGYKLSAKVNFDKKSGNNWVPYYENGLLVEDTANHGFITGAAPDTIGYQTLKELFPFFDQKNLYKGEPNKGVIKLKAPDHDFFIQYPAWKVRFEDMNGVVMGTTNAATFGDTLFSYSLPASLATNTSYKLLLIGDGNGADPDNPAIKINFTTSGYATLAQKVNALRLNQPIVNRISSDVIDLQAGVDNYEGFELYELKGNVYTSNQPTVKGVAILDNDPYYNNYIRDRIYTPFPYTVSGNNVIQLTEQENLVYGAPPVNAITLAWYYVNYLQSNTYSGLLKTRLPFVYDLNRYYNRHFLELRTKVINTYLGNNGGNGIPAPLQPLIVQPFPFMLSGPHYKTRFTFVNLDGTTGTSGDFDYVNPIE